jgi:tellurite methyltransferase
LKRCDSWSNPEREDGILTETDRDRWDRKYTAGEGPAHFRPQTLLTDNEELLKGGTALDLACGFGGSALYLAVKGYRVHAVDISGVALAQARAEALRRRAAEISFVQADVSSWRVPAGFYDLAIVFCYLDRALMPALVAGLRPGGLLFRINRSTHFLSARPGFDRSYLVEPDELYLEASRMGLEVLFFSKETDTEPFTSQLIARRP